jgi:O-methyltransferase
MSISLISKLFKPLRSSAYGSRNARKKLKRIQAMDDDAGEIYLEVQDYTMLNPEKLYAFIQAVRYVARNGIQGDIVECGVWRGGAIMAAALTLNQINAEERNFYLYDTFSGMSRPTDKDKACSGTKHLDLIGEFEKKRTGEDSSDWCLATIDEVRENLARIPYDQSRFRLVEGKVEDTIPGVLPGSIAILRLDTDWYESTSHEMQHLMPLLVPKGVLIVDDYYRWTGNKDAVDEYLEQHGIPVLMNRVGNSAIGVKPC